MAISTVRLVYSLNERVYLSTLLVSFCLFLLTFPSEGDKTLELALSDTDKPRHSISDTDPRRQRILVNVS
jgi:hypothetical protein